MSRQIENLTGLGKTYETKSADQLYEDLGENMERSIFDTTLDELVEGGFLTAAVFNDELGYHRSEGLTWLKVREIDNQNKQAILKYFIDKPDTFFLLVTTQKGKSNIVAKQIKSWLEHGERRIVTIIIVDNDQGLSDQTVSGLESQGMSIKLYHLSGSAKVNSSIEIIKNAIDSYSAFGGASPLIVALNNSKQISKIKNILDHICLRNKTIPELQYGLIFDEADKVYPQYRNIMVDYTKDNASAKHCVGYVSATDGELINSEGYPECANASVLYGEIDEEDIPYYNAIHLAEDINIKKVEGRTNEKNNKMAIETINKNIKWFTEKIKTKSGNYTFRKTIVNSNASKKDMEEFANSINDLGFHALVYNQYGVTVHRHGSTGAKPIIRTRRSNLNKVLLYGYKVFNLDDRPLFVIGRRKVDRGLGFHYAPRCHRQDFAPKSEELEYIKGMKVIINGKEGLIWTDEILGHIQDKDTAVQKAGRLAGIVKQCPEYPECGLTWWTTDDTKNSIIIHNKIIDDINTQAATGCSGTALQTLNRAKNNVEDDPDSNFEHGYKIFDTQKENENFAKTVGAVLNSEYKVNEFGFKMCSSSSLRVHSLSEIENLEKGNVCSNLDKNKSVLKVGEYAYRKYVCYTDINDNTSEKYVTRWCKRTIEKKNSNSTN